MASSKVNDFTSSRNVYMHLDNRHYMLLNWYNGTKYVHLKTKGKPLKSVTLRFPDLLEGIADKVPEMEAHYDALVEDSVVKGPEPDDDVSVIELKEASSSESEEEKTYQPPAKRRQMSDRPKSSLGKFVSNRKH